jgi:dTDP-L-rhamnose 4-epimerase
VVTALTEAGTEVVVLDSLRPDVHRDCARSSDADLVVCDVRDAEVLDRVLPGVDALVHPAAKVGLGVDVADMDDYVSSNDLGTAVLLRRCAVAG